MSQLEEIAIISRLIDAADARLKAMLRELAPVTPDKIMFVRADPHPPEVITPDMIAVWQAEYPELDVEHHVRDCAAYFARPDTTYRTDVNRTVRNWLNRERKRKGISQPKLKDRPDLDDILEEGL